MSKLITSQWDAKHILPYAFICCRMLTAQLVIYNAAVTLQYLANPLSNLTSCILRRLTT